MNQIRLFIKTPFINKGIDFIDLPSIFRDNTVESSIPDYFEKKNRLLFAINIINIFNLNKLVAYLDIDTKTPDS